MSQAWHVSRDGQVFGPFTDEQLHQMVESNRLLQTDLVHTPPMQEWCEAGTVEGLFPSAPTPAAEAAPAPQPTPQGEARTVQIHCFSCFNEAAVSVEVGTYSVACPSCGELVHLQEAPVAREDDMGDPSVFGGF